VCRNKPWFKEDGETDIQETTYSTQREVFASKENFYPP